MRSTPFLTAVVVCLAVSGPLGAELKAPTGAAFDRYVRVTEVRIGGDAPFLWVETLPDAQRQANLQAMRRGELVIERLETHEAGKKIDVQCEAISLTRDIPFGCGWIVKPFVTAFPRIR